MDQERLIELEIKISHQEIAIEKLQELMFAQDTVIQRLELSLKILKERIEGVTQGEGQIGSAGEKPPHY